MWKIKIKSYCILILSIFICICCYENSDNTYFNGEIRIIEDNIRNTENIKLKSVSLKGANFGWVSVYDSIMIFFNPKLDDNFYNIFNINTGEEIGSFCKKGGGPDEVAALGPISQFFKEGNELKTLLFAPNEEKLVVWNISQSIKQGITIMDRIIPYIWRTENNGACYDLMFLQSRNLLFAKVQSFPINEEEAISPFYQKRTIDTNKLLKDYLIYIKSVKNKNASIIPDAFFNSNDAFKPDGTKVVQAMIHIPQLNIIDLQTGKIIGYRLKDGDDFSIFEGKKNIKDYYIRLQADNNYIYALYWGKEPWGYNEIPYINTIHVFDWNGNLLRKVSMDRAVDKMWIDTVRNRLYITGPKTDDVFYWDISLRQGNN